MCLNCPLMMMMVGLCLLYGYDMVHCKRPTVTTNRLIHLLLADARTRRGAGRPRRPMGAAALTERNPLLPLACCLVGACLCATVRAARCCELYRASYLHAYLITYLLNSLTYLLPTLSLPSLQYEEPLVPSAEFDTGWPHPAWMGSCAAC